MVLVKKDKINILSSPELIFIPWSMDMPSGKHYCNDILTDKGLLKLLQTVIQVSSPFSERQGRIRE